MKKIPLHKLAASFVSIIGLSLAAIVGGVVPAQAVDNPTALTFNQSAVVTNSTLTGTFKYYADYGTGNGSCGGNPSAIAGLAPVRFKAKFADPANLSSSIGEAWLTDSSDSRDFPFDGTSDYTVNFKIEVPFLSAGGLQPINQTVTISDIVCYSTGNGESLESIQTVSAPSVSYTGFTAPSTVIAETPWTLSIDGGANIAGKTPVMEWCYDYPGNTDVYTLGVVYDDGTNTYSFPTGFDPNASSTLQGFGAFTPSADSAFEIPSNGVPTGTYEVSVYCVETAGSSTWWNNYLTTRVSVTADGSSNNSGSALASTGSNATSIAGFGIAVAIAGAGIWFLRRKITQ